jgi:hypothetical protein
MHLGHYKAMIAKHSFNTDASDDDLTEDFIRQRDELNQKQAEIRTLHLQLINYALERGYSFQRWQNVANTILFKDKDNVRVHRTRVIHIYEADFNLCLGIKWRVALRQAEDLKLLNDGQYGSRSYRNAIDPVFLEELQFEMSRATWKSLILTNYDAMACFDRIIPSIAAIVSQKYGVAKSVVKTNTHMLENATYRIRTDSGLTDKGYKHEPSNPMYGTGQGSANSPAIWCFISSALFDGYETEAHQATYVDPQGNKGVSLSMVGFVDDCNGQTKLFSHTESKEARKQIMNRAQQNAQLWTDLLDASGGALELTKCSCHVLQWDFSKQGAPILSPKQGNAPRIITVTDSSGNLHKLQELSPYTAHKTLGHYKDPAGLQIEQKKRLRLLCDGNTKFLWNCPLTRREAWTYYFACFLPSVCSPLACSYFTKTQLETIQRKSMSIIIARCGYNRNTKREIIYGPLEYGGANFRHLYHQQGIGQVLTFLKHWRSQLQAVKLLRIAVRWFHQAIGMPFSMFENVTQKMPHLESKWLAAVRDFLATIPASSHLDSPGIPPIQRIHDEHIMEVVIRSG